MNIRPFVITADFVLVGVFLTAGLAKFIDRVTMSRFLRSLGFGRRFSRLSAEWLPILEITLATMLFSALTRRVANVGIFAAMMFFNLVLLIDFTSSGAPLRRTLACGCFGGASRGRVGALTVLRNFLLTGIAAFALWNIDLTLTGERNCLCDVVKDVVFMSRSGR